MNSPTPTQCRCGDPDCDHPYEPCPSCGGETGHGTMVYSCELCGKDCCTMCSDTTSKHAVVCDDCLDGGYDDGWTQGRGFSENA